MKHLTLIPFALALFILFWTARDLPPLGDIHSPASEHVSPRYIQHGTKEAGAKNLVTNVLVDYRGYDTLGETTVIFTAGLACLLLLGLGKDES